MEYVPVVFPQNAFVSTLAPFTPELYAPIITFPKGCVIVNVVVELTTKFHPEAPIKLLPLGSVALVTDERL